MIGQLRRDVIGRTPKNALSDGKQLEGFALPLPQALKFPGKFLQWLQNELAHNFEPLKEELTCVRLSKL